MVASDDPTGTVGTTDKETMLVALQSVLLLQMQLSSFACCIFFTAVRHYWQEYAGYTSMLGYLELHSLAGMRGKAHGRVPHSVLPENSSAFFALPIYSSSLTIASYLTPLAIPCSLHPHLSRSMHKLIDQLALLAHICGIRCVGSAAPMLQCCGWASLLGSAP